MDEILNIQLIMDINHPYRIIKSSTKQTFNDLLVKKRDSGRERKRNNGQTCL